MKYKVAIFDLDGTVLATLEDLANAVNHALETNGYASHTIEELRCMVGNGVANLIKRAVPAGTSEEETAATLAKATCRGSALLSELSDRSLEDLRIAVCSPGGTTIEGVESLWASDLDGVVEKALKAAYDRSVELAAN